MRPYPPAAEVAVELDPDPWLVEAALRCERRFVLTLGGLAVEIPGATLVTHEKVPVPRFNFVEVRGVSRERQAAFFERVLDHYFQRALRPVVRVPEPVPDHMALGLSGFGFRPRERPLRLLVAAAAAPGGPPSDPAARAVRARPARPSEIGVVAAFWTGERERPEFLAALDTAWAHPQPDERLAPLLGTVDDLPVATAIVYRDGTHAGLYGVATRTGARGQGAATELVGEALRSDPAGRPAAYSLWIDAPSLPSGLAPLGFRPIAEFREFELPPDAELSLPPPGPPGPPRWRPPRTPGPDDSGPSQER